MRVTKLFTKTLRDAPADEVAKNAQLLIRAGFVYKEMAGVYAYLPLGIRVVEKIKQVVREEMNAIDSFTSPGITFTAFGRQSIRPTVITASDDSPRARPSS